MNTGSRWVRIWMVVSILWGAIVIASTVRLVTRPPSFETAASELCPQLLLRPMPRLEAALQKIDPRFFFKVMVWRDARTREEISPYRKGEQMLSCNALEARAKLFLAGAEAGIIEPQVHLRTRLLTLIVVLSSLLLAPVVYLLHLPFSKGQAQPRGRLAR